MVKLQLDELNTRMRAQICGSGVVQQEKQARSNEHRRATAVRHWWDLKVDHQIDKRGSRNSSRRGEGSASRGSFLVDGPEPTSLTTATAVSSIAKKLRRNAEDWQEARRVERHLHFVCKPVRLPSRAEVRGWVAEERRWKGRAANAAALATAVQQHASAGRVISRFQRQIRAGQRLRRRVRHIEFNAWCVLGQECLATRLQDCDCAIEWCLLYPTDRRCCAVLVTVLCCVVRTARPPKRL